MTEQSKPPPLPEYTLPAGVYDDDGLSKEFIKYGQLCRDQLQAENERLKMERDELREFHDSAMIELALKCGADISDEPRFKWVSLEVHRVVRERDKLRAQLADLTAENERLQESDDMLREIGTLCRGQTRFVGSYAEIVKQALGELAALAAQEPAGYVDKKTLGRLHTYRGEFRALLAEDKAGGDAVAIDVMIAHTEKPVPTYIDDSTGYAREYFTEQDLEQYGRGLLSALYTRPQPQADDKKDAALKACVEAMQQVHIIGGQAAIDAAITQAQEALK